MDAPLPGCRHQKSPQLSGLAQGPGSTRAEGQAGGLDPRCDRLGAIPTNNAIRAKINDGSLAAGTMAEKAGYVSALRKAANHRSLRHSRFVIMFRDPHPNGCSAAETAPMPEPENAAPEDMHSLLKNHTLWVATDGTQGERADLRNAHLA